MSILDFLFGNKDKNSAQNHLRQSQNSLKFSSQGSGLNMSKEEAISKLNMRKQTMSKICMTKGNLSNIRARVAVVMDYSGSMDYLYEKGIVQDIVERLLPIGLQFDDNGELDMWLFNDDFERLPSVTERDFYDYVNREIVNSRYHMGGTNYAPVMKDVLEKYVYEEAVDYPSLVLFITDGDNFDKGQAESVIREASKNNIFWQFVGVGDNDFSFLERLDEMDGRFVDNANFFSIEDISRISDDELYARLLNEYPSWELQARKKGLIK